MLPEGWNWYCWAHSTWDNKKGSNYSSSSFSHFFFFWIFCTKFLDGFAFQTSVPLEEARKKIWLVDSKVYIMIWRSSKMLHAINWSLPTCLNIIYVRISISFSHKQFFIYYRDWWLVLVWSPFSTSKSLGLMITNLLRNL